MALKLKCLFEGKIKILYKTEDPEVLIQHFKDDATVFNAKTKGMIKGKGIINNSVSSTIFEFLERNGIATHYVKMLSDREMLVKNLKMFPVEVVVRNLTAGSLARRMGVEEGTELDDIILEFYYKNDDLGDPMVNKSHIRVFNLVSNENIRRIEEITLETNHLLLDFFNKRGLSLVDYRLEFGCLRENILIAGEITPDGCRLWDRETSRKLDINRFQKNVGHIWDEHNEIYSRVCA